VWVGVLRGGGVRVVVGPMGVGVGVQLGQQRVGQRSEAVGGVVGPGVVVVSRVGGGLGPAAAAQHWSGGSGQPGKGQGQAGVPAVCKAARAFCPSHRIHLILQQQQEMLRNQ
jgi:hypothetical protein